MRRTRSICSVTVRAGFGCSLGMYTDQNWALTPPSRSRGMSVWPESSRLRQVELRRGRNPHRCAAARAGRCGRRRASPRRGPSAPGRRPAAARPLSSIRARPDPAPTPHRPARSGKPRSRRRGTPARGSPCSLSWHHLFLESSFSARGPILLRTDSRDNGAAARSRVGDGRSGAMPSAGSDSRRMRGQNDRSGGPLESDG